MNGVSTFRHDAQVEVEFEVFNCVACGNALYDDVESRKRGRCRACAGEDVRGVIAGHRARAVVMLERVKGYFLDHYAVNDRFPTFKVAAEALQTTEPTIKKYIDRLCAEGILVKAGRNRLALGKLTRSEYASISGKRGAVSLKKSTLAAGVRFGQHGAVVSKYEAGLQSRIEAVVRKAEAAGTVCHPRPKFVVLIGEKVG